jgi:hypothetical protein
MACTSPTARTLERADALGFTAQNVEKWIPHTRRRLDLFGCIDIVAVHPRCGIIGIQATSASNHAARRTKSAAEPRLRRWLKAGGRFEIWSWKKCKQRGPDNKFWQLRREELFEGDLTSENV